MSLVKFDHLKCKQILKTSEGFPSQWESPSIVIQRKPQAHAISRHLRGASEKADETKKPTLIKTKFCSLDDMAHALSLALNTPQGQDILRRLRPGAREILDVNVIQLFSIEIITADGNHNIYSQSDLTKINLYQTKCLAVLECRQREEVHLHVQTFYPKLNAAQIEQLWELNH